MPRLLFLLVATAALVACGKKAPLRPPNSPPPANEQPAADEPTDEAAPEDAEDPEDEGLTELYDPLLGPK